MHKLPGKPRCIHAFMHACMHACMHAGGGRYRDLVGLDDGTWNMELTNFVGGMGSAVRTFYWQQ